MTSKHTIHLMGHSLPVELPAERILTNNVIFSGEFNPHNIRLWVIGNAYGALGAVWAGNEQDALDQLVDAGLGDQFLVDEQTQAEQEDDLSYLGNAGEAADLTDAWMATA